jgi:hypothetical protein
MTTASWSSVHEPQEALGLVVKAQIISADTRQPINVTEEQMQDAIDPRAKLVDLSKYEGRAILISCQTNDGSFLWGSNLISTTGPILTGIVKKVFDLK